jgi:hypothetical protein
MSEVTLLDRSGIGAIVELASRNERVVVLTGVSVWFLLNRDAWKLVRAYGLLTRADVTGPARLSRR